MIKRCAKFLITTIQRIKSYNKCKFNVFNNIVIRNNQFEGKNCLGENNFLSNVYLGYGTYIGSQCSFTNCKIGRFCSISNNVKIISGTHPIKRNVSTHPSFFSNSYKILSYNNKPYGHEILETENGFSCEIGNDVWIGDGVMIKGGTIIGDGAVIAMGSVVVKDVPPYAIVGGVPAKIIKKRFDDSKIEQLLHIKWWERDVLWIKENASRFSDVDTFIENSSKENKNDNM